MIDVLKKISHHTLIYSVGGMANKLIGFVLLPIYTSHLSVQEYGILAILEVTNQFVVTVVGFRLSTAMMRWYADCNEERDRKKVIFSGLFGVLMSIILLNSINQPFADQYAYVLLDDTEFSSYFSYLFLWASFEVLTVYIFDIIRIKEKSVLFISLTIVRLVVTLLLNIFFVVHMKLGILGIIYGNLIGGAFTTIITLPVVIRNTIFELDRKVMIGMLRFGFPLIFSNLSSLALTLGDRFFIKYFLTLEDVGIYSFAIKIANVVKLIVVQSFQAGFFPIAFKMFDAKGADRFFGKLFSYFMLLVILSSVSMFLFADDIISVLLSDKSMDYLKGTFLIPLISVLISFRAAQAFFTIGFHYSKKTYLSAYILLIAVLLNFAFNALLIPRFELLGVILGTAIADLVVLVLYFKVSQKYYRVLYNKSQILLMIVCLFFSVTMYYFVSSLDLAFYARLLLKAGVILSVVGLLLVCGFFSNKDYETLKRFFS